MVFSNIIPVNIPILDTTVPMSLCSRTGTVSFNIVPIHGIISIQKKTVPFWTLFPLPDTNIGYSVTGIDKILISTVLVQFLEYNKKSIQKWYCLIPPAEAWCHGYRIVDGNLRRLTRFWTKLFLHSHPIYSADQIQTWYSPLQVSTSTLLVNG